MEYLFYMLEIFTVLYYANKGSDDIIQDAKKVVSNSLGLVDFVLVLVNSVLNLPDGQAKIFQRIKITKVL